MKERLVVEPWELYRPNPWNPNRMTEEQFEAAYNSIRLHGFVTPLIVREAKPLSSDNIKQIIRRITKNVGIFAGMDRKWLKNYLTNQHKYEIIDGEHRWAALKKLFEDIEDGKITVVKAKRAGSGFLYRGKPLTKNQIAEQAVATFVQQGKLIAPAIALANIDDAAAKWLTLVLNETRGEVNPQELGRLLREIGNEVDPEILAQEIPLTPTDIEDLIAIGEFDFDAVEQLRTQAAEDAERESEGEEWVNFSFEVETSEADRFNQARSLVEDQLKADGYELHKKAALANGQALELIAADFLAAG